MADTSVDWSSIDPSVYTPTDLSYLSANQTTDPNADTPVPGLFGTVGPQPMVSDGVATADTLSSSDGISVTANTDSSWSDGSSAAGLGGTNPTFWDSQGNILQATQDQYGYWHLSDGSIVDPATGNKWNSDGNSTPLDPSTPASTSGLGPALPLTGKPTGSSSSSGATDLSALSKAIGNLGASLAALLAAPKTGTPTAAQLAAQNSTIAGLPSALNSSGTLIFVVGALVLVYLLVRS